MLADHVKPFHVKSELFTEYTDKNRFLLEISKRERRKLVNERNMKKAAGKNNVNNTTEKEKEKKKSFKGNIFNVNTKANKTTKSRNETADRINNFPTKNKFKIKSGVL